MSPETVSIINTNGPPLIRWGVLIALAFPFNRPITMAVQGLGDALSSLARRRIKFPGGFSIDDQDAAPSQTPAPADAADAVMNVAPTTTTDEPMLTEVINFINQRVKQAPGGVNTVIRETAQIVVAAIGYQIYSTIFGSQLSLLKLANLSGNVGVDDAHARSIYDLARTNDPTFYSQYSYEQWIGYMISSVLLQKQGARYAITIRGKAFLQFIAQVGLSDFGIANNAGK